LRRIRVAGKPWQHLAGGARPGETCYCGRQVVLVNVGDLWVRAVVLGIRLAED